MAAPILELLYGIMTGGISSAFNAPLTSSLVPNKGTLDSFTRGDADATVTDFEGLVKDVQADEARFELFLAGDLQGAFTAALTEDELLQFDLPGEGLVADRVVVTNITPDPPGVNDLATMTFDDAGVAYVVAPPAVPSTSVRGAAVLVAILMLSGWIVLRVS